jgi:Ring finger domain
VTRTLFANNNIANTMKLKFKTLFSAKQREGMVSSSVPVVSNEVSKDDATLPVLLSMRVRSFDGSKNASASSSSTSSAAWLLDKECLICTENIAGHEIVCRLHCCGGRWYHTRCIKQWWNRNPSCPLCREAVKDMPQDDWKQHEAANSTTPLCVFIPEPSYRQLAMERSAMIQNSNPNFDLIMQRVMRARELALAINDMMLESRLAKEEEIYCQPIREKNDFDVNTTYAFGSGEWPPKDDGHFGECLCCQ